MAELKAIRAGIDLALSLGGNKVIIETDCIQAFNLVSHKVEARNEVGTLVEDIWSLASLGDDIVFSFVHREGNLIADFIAKRAKRVMMNDSWRVFLPQWLVDLVS